MPQFRTSRTSPTPLHCAEHIMASGWCWWFVSRKSLTINWTVFFARNPHLVQAGAGPTPIGPRSPSSFRVRARNGPAWGASYFANRRSSATRSNAATPSCPAWWTGPCSACLPPPMRSPSASTLFSRPCSQFPPRWRGSGAIGASNPMRWSVTAWARSPLPTSREPSLLPMLPR